MRKIVDTAVIMVLFSCLLCFVNSSAMAQQTAPAHELLKDIEIMETVLDRLITSGDRNFGYFGSKNAQGYYLANYGVIFNVNYWQLNRTILSIDIDKRLRLGNIYFDTDEELNDTPGNADKELEELKKSIARFLGTWTSALKELKPEEKIAVIVDFNGFFSNFGIEPEMNLRQLVASITIAEINNYRKNLIDEHEFARRIVFDEVQSGDEDISILSNIIETSLAHEKNKDELGLGGHVKGIHFKGYGAIFFAEISTGANLYTQAWSIYSDAMKKEKGRTVTIRNLPDEPKDGRKGIEKVEQKLIHLISNYGHNLKNLQPEEWVEIAINFKGIPIKDNYSRSVLKVRKKTIDDYNRDTIKFDDFKKRVSVTYY